MYTQTKSIITSLLKYFLLAIACTYPVAMLMLDILWLNNGVGEHSFTEYSQSLLLILIISTFGYIIMTYEQERPLAYMAAGLFIAMLIREQNSLFNNMGAHLWETLVAITFVIAVILSRRSRAAFVPAFDRYLNSRAAQIMAIGLVILLFYSRFFGMSIIWTSLLDDGYVRTVKNAMEEGTELLAYVLILYASQVYRKQLAAGTYS